MLSKFSFASLLILFLTKSILAQDSLDILVFPSAKEIDFTSSCSVLKSNDTIKYSYEIYSLGTSQQDIDFFILDIFSDILKVSSPNGWHGGNYKVKKETVKWFASDTTKRIAPNEFLDGFDLSSKGLPIIVNSYCRGSVPFPVVTEDPDSIVGDNIYENSVQKRTIAPTSIPNPFDPLTFIDNLISMGDEVDSLKWIMGLPYNDYLLWPNLKTKLNNTYDYIDKSNYRKAKQELDSFLTAVEDYFKGRSKFITSEGYALMKYNGEYLLQWLTEERKN